MGVLQLWKVERESGLILKWSTVRKCELWAHNNYKQIISKENINRVSGFWFLTRLAHGGASFFLHIKYEVVLFFFPLFLFAVAGDKISLDSLTEKQNRASDTSPPISIILSFPNSPWCLFVPFQFLQPIPAFILTVMRQGFRFPN